MVRSGAILRVKMDRVHTRYIELMTLEQRLEAIQGVDVEGGEE